METIEIILLSEPISTSERFKPFNKKTFNSDPANASPILKKIINRTRAVRFLYFWERFLKAAITNLIKLRFFKLSWYGSLINIVNMKKKIRIKDMLR